jgi:NAD(P)-dependent dehydrogenase (short-subunit alcohol dehydrogenase family)
MKSIVEEKKVPTVFITGAGRGLGRSLAELFLEKGYRVFAGVRRHTRGTAAASHSNFHRVLIDVVEPGSIERAALKVASLTTGLDVLINNAAICESETSSLETLDFGKVAGILDVNTLGPLRVTKAFLPLLRRGSMKTIVNISSEAGSIESCWRKGMFGYCMSKAALNMQSKLLENRLAGDGFRIRSIHPGWMRTDMGGKNADIEPREAALGIYSIIINRRKKPIPLYVDYKGLPLKY